MKKPLLSYNTFHDLYIFIFCLNLFGMLGFGIYPSARSIMEKRQFLREMDEKNERFAAMLLAAEKSEDYFEEVGPYLPSLERAIPDKVYGDVLVKEMLFLTSMHGYTLENLSFSSRGDKTTDFSIDLEGDFKNIDELLEALENMDLSIKVESLAISFSDRVIGGGQNIRINLKIYYLDEVKRIGEDA